MVIFCQSIAHANKFAELMGDDAVVIHSQLPRGEVAQRLADFRAGKIHTVCCVDMLNEGIDIPRTDVIVFLRVTQSKIVFYQQLGRGLRRAEGKGDVLVLDFVANGERIDMIIRLEREFKSAQGRYKSGSVDSEREYFTLNIDTPQFRERKKDIISAIERAMTTTRNCQSFPEWRNQSKDFIWADIIRRFLEFRAQTGRMVTKTDLGTGIIPSMYFMKEGLGFDVTLAEILEKSYPDARRVWTKEKVDIALIEIAEYYGKVPRQKELREYARTHKNAVPSTETIRRFYKDFADAYEQLGYDMSKNYTPWPVGKIESGMHQAYDFFGRIPKTAEYERYREEHPDSLPCYDSIRLINGKKYGWREAFKIRIGANDIPEFTPEKAIHTLRYVAEKCKKESLSLAFYKDFRSAHPEENLPSHNQIVTVLKAKTWNEAKQKAEIAVTPQLGR